MILAQIVTIDMKGGIDMIGERGWMTDMKEENGMMIGTNEEIATSKMITPETERDGVDMMTLTIAIEDVGMITK